MRNKRDIQILTNACFFSAPNHAEGLMSIEQSNKSETSQAITSKNNAVMILVCHGNIFNAFDMQTPKPLF